MVGFYLAFGLPFALWFALALALTPCLALPYPALTHLLHTHLLPLALCPFYCLTPLPLHTFTPHVALPCWLVRCSSAATPVVGTVDSTIIYPPLPTDPDMPAPCLRPPFCGITFSPSSPSAVAHCTRSSPFVTALPARSALLPFIYALLRIYAHRTHTYITFTITYYPARTHAHLCLCALRSAIAFPSFFFL